MLENAKHQPYWYTQTESPEYPSLNQNIDCDAVIVGAGITGLSAALYLAKSYADVVVIEMNSMANSSTALSTGHLDNYYDQQYSKLIKNYGANDAQKIIQSKKEAIDIIGTNVNEFDMHCDFHRVPAYLYCENDEGVSLIDNENDSAFKIKIETFFADKNPLPFNTKRTIIFPDQARISPYAYIVQMAKAITSSHGRIFEHTAMKGFKEQDGKLIIHTSGADIHANNLILCGHTALTGKLSLQTRIYPMLSFVIVADVEDKIEDALYWDTDEPYHYTRIASTDNPSLLMIGGADCHVGTEEDTAKCFEDLINYAKQRYRVKSIPYYWCNEYYEPSDGLPYAGFVPFSQKVLVAGAYTGDGLTFGTMSAKLVADLIMKRSNPLEKILDPSRIKPILSAGKVTKNVGHAAKHLVIDRITKKESDIDVLLPEQGCLAKINNQIYAVYKDNTGSVHAFSASCRHMGCIVKWNSVEKTWDCPCHGGRYDCMGNVISGPPREGLKKVEVFEPAIH